MEKIIKKDELYWAGRPTGMSDAEFDRLSQLSGLISQPRARGWARFPKAKLSRPNFGMEKIYGETALADYMAGLPSTVKPRYRPKYDGIFVQVFFDELITRGDGRTGLDISDWSIKSRVLLPWRLLRDGDVVFGELVLPKPYGRNDLVRAIAADKAPPCDPVVIPHDGFIFDGMPPLDIPPTYHVPDFYADGFDVDIDGWVCQFGTGNLVAFKKNNI